MQYILTGFTHNKGFRVFAFEGIGEDRIRTEYKVSADLALIHRYGILIQELPLLCRSILERPHEDEKQRTFTYTESDMRRNAEIWAIRADEQKKKAPRKPPSQNVGVAWRGPQV